MNTYTRTLFLSAMAAVGITQGCSCSDDDNKAGTGIPVSPPGETPVPAAINGAAAKGLIIGGIVNVHPIINGALSDTSIATSTTSDTGNYSVTIDDYDGSPFVVRVTAADDGSTSMRCDLAGGCGEDVNFGSTFSFNDADFNLDAVVPPIADPTANSMINLSVLTDTATEVALGSLSGDASIESVIAAISNANASVANRFGVMGDITTLPIVDLTNPASLVDVPQNVLQYNLLSAGIVEALIGDNPATSIADAVGNFATQYASIGLSDNAATSTVTSLSEILEQASNVIDAIQAADTQGVINLTDLENVIDTNQELAGLQPPTDQGTQGTPSGTAGAEPLAKARAMVAVISDLGANIDMTMLADGVTLGAEAEEFEMQLEAAEMASSDAMEQVLEATAKVIEAFGEAYDAYDEDSSNLTYTAEGGFTVTLMEVMSTPVEGQGAMVEGESTVVAGENTAVAGESTMVDDENTVVESVKMMVGTADQAASVMVYHDGMMSEVDVYMMAMEDIETTDSSTDGTDTETAAGMLMISGTAANAEVMLTVKEGSSVMLGEAMAISSESDSEEQTEVSISGLELDLMAMIEQKTSATVTDPVSFDGAIKVMLESFKATETVMPAEAGEMGAATQEISVLSFMLSGTVMAASGNAAKIVLNLQGDGTGLDFSQDWLGDFDSDDRMDSDPEADNFAAVSLSLAFEADLAGVSDAVTAMFTSSRTGEDVATVSLKLNYADIALDLRTMAYDDDMMEQAATLANQDGVIIKVTDTDDGVMGEMFVGTQKVADIDGAQVRYTIRDENNETIIDFLDIFSDDDEGEVTDATSL